MARGLVLSFGLWVAGVVIQIILVQTLRPRKMFNFAFSVFIVTLCLYFVSYAFLPVPGFTHSNHFGFINGAFVHFLLFLNYMQFFYYLTRPVTIRILLEFLKPGNGRLKRQELEELYNLKDMIASRLALMQSYGYVSSSNGHYVLTQKGKCFANFFIFLRYFFGVAYYLER